MTQAMVLANDTAPQGARFSDEQKRLILQTCCGGANEKEALALVAIAEARGMNPLRQDCYFVQRGGKWSVQASIDSFRQKAEESGDYAGQDEPEYEYDNNGAIVLARVRVYRKSVQGRAFAVGVARWKEYAQDSSPMWKKMAHTMIAKCAEALALRKAFPAALGKVYTREEMDQATNEGPGTVQAMPSPPRGPLAKAEGLAPVKATGLEERLLELGEMMAETQNPAELEEFAREAKSMNGKVSPELLLSVSNICQAARKRLHELEADGAA